ncbi:MAG: hypothetical protein U9R19_04130 [Bacteroidota bacterium]|nr:hypothetical protein [Bacteroidota bacterium]
MKKHFTMFYKFLPLFLLAVFLLAQCRQEIEPVDTLTYEPGLAIAIAHGHLSLNDLIPDDDPYFSVGQDGSIKFSYREDSIQGFSVDEFFEIPIQEAEELKFKLGEIALDNFGPIEAVASLDEMIEVIDPGQAAFIQSLDGTTANLPAMQSVDKKRFDFNDFDDFEYVVFSDGWLILGVKNNLPVTFSSTEMTLYTINPGGDSTVVGAFVFNNLMPGVVQIDSISLAGLTLYNDFMVILNSFESLASTNNVLINLSDYISMELNSHDIKVIAGKAKIPAQEISNQADSVDFSVDSNERLTFIKLDQASLHYNVQSFMDLDAGFSLKLPSVTVDGQTVDLSFSANNGANGVFDLSNSLFDLTSNPAQPYNYLPVIIELQINGSNTWVEFDSSSVVQLNYDIGDLSFDLVQGWIGMKHLDIGIDSINLDFDELQNISGNIYLSNPMIHLIVDNNIGLPINFDLDLMGLTNEGTATSLNANTLHFPYPLMPGNEITGEKMTLSNANSQLSDFLSVLPDQLFFGGEIITNPDSATTGVVYSNFITGDGHVKLGLEFELPMEFSIQDLQFTDTIEFSISEEVIEEAIAGHLSVVTNNGIPFETSLNLEFIDSVSQQVFDSYMIDLLEAAPVDANGVVTNTVEKISKIELDTDRFNSLQNANKIIITALINTSSSNLQEVVFYSDYTLDVNLGILINYSYDIE